MCYSILAFCGYAERIFYPVSTPETLHSSIDTGHGSFESSIRSELKNEVISTVAVNQMKNNEFKLDILGNTTLVDRPIVDECAV